MAAYTHLGASIAGWDMRCPSHPKLCLRAEVGLSRHAAAHVAGMYGPVLFGLARCYRRMRGAQASQLRMTVMSSYRLARQGSGTRLLSFRCVR